MDWPASPPPSNTKRLGVVAWSKIKPDDAKGRNAALAATICMSCTSGWMRWTAMSRLRSRARWTAASRVRSKRRAGCPACRATQRLRGVAVTVRLVVAIRGGTPSVCCTAWRGRSLDARLQDVLLYGVGLAVGAAWVVVERVRSAAAGGGRHCTPRRGGPRRYALCLLYGARGRSLDARLCKHALLYGVEGVSVVCVSRQTCRSMTVTRSWTEAVAARRRLRHRHRRDATSCGMVFGVRAVGSTIKEAAAAGGGRGHRRRAGGRRRRALHRVAGARNVRKRKRAAWARAAGP